LRPLQRDGVKRCEARVPTALSASLALLLGIAPLPALLAQDAPPEPILLEPPMRLPERETPEPPKPPASGSPSRTAPEAAALANTASAPPQEDQAAPTEPTNGAETPPPTAVTAPASESGSAAAAELENPESDTAPMPASDAPPEAAPAPLETLHVPDAEPTAWGPPALLPEGDPRSESFIGPRLIEPLRLLGVEVEPGSKLRLEWKASQSFSGGEVISPVIVVHGVRSGPRLCLTAAVHGDELNGVEIVRRVSNRVDAKNLAGSLIAVPIVNLFGFSRGSRYLPDRRDLNRYFPGSARGSVASRMAHSFFENIARHCDGIVDFHTGSFERSNLPQIRADLTIPEVREFSRGFGATTVLQSRGSEGMLRVAATAAGIPAVTFEVGGPLRLQPEEIAFGVQAIETLMHKLGMLVDSPDWDEPQPIYYASRWVRAAGGGMLISDVAMGQRVGRGERLGVVIDPLANTERAIYAPFDGRVLGMALNQVVLPGFAAYHLGEETSEQAAAEGALESDEDPADEHDHDASPDR
jgi:uncharacterized protein